MGRIFLATLLGALALSLAVCKDDAPAPTSAASTGQGEGGCPAGPPEAALFDVVVRTSDGEPLPADTTVTVRWSASVEPSFRLDDPATWKTLEDGVNVVCTVEEGRAMIHELHCELWTSGPNEVEVTATGYLDLVETLTPEAKEGCDAPVPSEQELELLPEADPEASE